MHSQCRRPAFRGLTVVTSTINETVTLLKERVFFFLKNCAGNSTGGVKEKGLSPACESTGNSTRGRAHSPTAIVDSLMSAPFLSLRRRSHHIGMKNDVTVWDSGLCDPVQCAHLLGNELKIDCLFFRMPFRGQKVFSRCFPTASRCSASSACAHPRRMIWTPPRSMTCGPSGPPSPCLWF